MKIFHISAECYPVAKVGGLADVVGALPKYQNRDRHSSQVVMPFYNHQFSQENDFTSIYSTELKLNGEIYPFQILRLKKPSILDFEVFFVHIPGLLDQEYIYSYNDTERFLAFQIAALDWINSLATKPDLIHCHDHHTGLIPFMLQESFAYKNLNNIPNIFTIHNAQYQGWFSHNLSKLIPDFSLNHVGLIDWEHQINPMAAAIKCAWRVTTVSPSYMEELKTNANGLENLLAYEKHKCTGILNGIDTKVWDPATDKYLTKNYTKASIANGKKTNKDWLCQTFELDKNKPLFVFIGRLVGEKGSDLFFEVFKQVLKDRDISILLLGSGDKAVEDTLNSLKSEFSDVYNNYIGYNEKLAHTCYAGGDFLIMPSRIEPCGLNQLYAMRYGTLPIVNNTGGLRDTVKDISENGHGIVIPETSVDEIVKGINRAKSFYRNAKFKKIRRLIMDLDYSWDQSATSYHQLYKTLLKNKQ